MKGNLISGIVSSLAAALAGCVTTGDIAAVQDFEPERYMGTWYEIARLPQYFERDLDEVRAEYTLNPDGTIRVVNSGVRDGEAQSITGKAKLRCPNAKPLTGELRVSFFWPFYSDYRIIELTPDYDVAVVTAGTNPLGSVHPVAVTPAVALGSIVIDPMAVGAASDLIFEPPFSTMLTPQQFCTQVGKSQ